MTPEISFVVESAKWRKGRLLQQLRRAAKLTWLRSSHDKSRTQFTILLTDDAKLRALNARFRGKNRPTNVLSFPTTGSGSYLGDIALAFGTAAREAKVGEKSLAAHSTHLVVHGVLHLLGYDHERAREAREMETLETQILAELGIADPYAARRAA
jgi:probable rRNA maturation factor